MLVHSLWITSVNYPIFKNSFTISWLLFLRLMRFSHSYRSVEKFENNSIFKQTVIFKKQGQVLQECKKHPSECSFQRDVPFVLYSMKIKEQTRKPAADCSKHCFEVVDKTDEVSHIYTARRS